MEDTTFDNNSIEEEIDLTEELIEELRQAKEEKEEEPVYFNNFNPNIIKFQQRIVWDIEKEYNYKKGVQVVVFSGAVASGKSVLGAHLIWKYAMENANSKIGIGRLDLGRLKKSFLPEILLHAPKGWVIGKNGYTFNKSELVIRLPNGSEIHCFSWSNLSEIQLENKFKSQEFGMFVIEEASESEAIVFKSIFTRMGRSKRIKRRLLMLLSNPGESTHWIKTDIIDKSLRVDGKISKRNDGTLNENFHTYYSLTVQNPFVDPSYVINLKRVHHQKWVERNLEGKWNSFGGDGIYHAYNEDDHYKLEDYLVDLSLPIYMCWDFNTAMGKPMSMCFMQYKNGEAHYFDECVMQGNTSQLLEEIANKGQLNYETKYIITGDAAGYAKHSAANGYSDYDVILRFMANYKHKKLKYDIQVPDSNPGIKERHNLVNDYLKNGLNQVRLYVYKKCPTLNLAFKLTKLKAGGKFVEDDGPSCPWQHIGGAAGYGLNIVANLSAKSYSFRK